ncbi:MAG: HAMP domain-containing protein, partial [Actinomycetes bacterium]
MSRAWRPGLTVRLLAAQLLVVVAAAVAAGLAAIAVGPPIFRSHLGQDPHVIAPASAAAHAEQAFQDAGAVSLAVALLAALVSATVVSAFVTGRIARPVKALAAAAADVSVGQYDVDVPAPALGAEFDTLTSSFGA